MFKASVLYFTFKKMHKFDEPVPTAASAFCSWLTEVEPDAVLCCWSAF